MPVVEDFSFDNAERVDPACKCGCAIEDHMGPDGGACVCGCPEYRAGPAGVQAATGDQAVA
jgi:hypothetical protein